MYVQLSHAPGCAQCDFGQARAAIEGANACLRYVPFPVWLLQCHMGLKISEVRRMNNPQMSFFPEEPPEDKLRVRHGSYSPSAEDLGIRFHPNMRVPGSSIVTLGFHEELGGAQRRY